MMILKLFITFIINIVITICRHHHHHTSHHRNFVNILKSQDNFYSITSETVKTVVNNLFQDMQLTEQFIDSSRIKLLLTMFYDLSNLASNNYNFYDTLKNITKVDASNKAVKRIGLDETVREIVNENQFEVYNNTKEKYREDDFTVRAQAVTEHTTKHWEYMSEFKDSKEFKHFIGSFLNKINSLTVDDLFKKSPSVYEENKTRRTLKVWVPPADLQYMYNGTDYRRIFGGKSTSIKNYSFIVSVLILKDFMCAGSLIADDLVVTAASCLQVHFNNRFYRENPRTTTVRIGSDWISRRGEVIRVVEIFFYPTYDPNTLRNNLAILRIGRAIKFKRKPKSKVKRISLDEQEGNLPSNVREIIILGWGASTANQIVNRFQKLQVSALQIYPLDACQEVYSKKFVNENNFCAGFMTKGGGACNRDLGAPGIVSGRLSGIVSFGSPVCGAENAPTVFTKLGNYFDWIETIMATRTPRYGVAKSTKATSKAYYFYHNAVTKRKVILEPVNTYSPPIPVVSYRTYDKTNPEEAVLSEIITNLRNQNSSLLHDVINHAFSEDNSGKDTTHESDTEQGLFLSEKQSPSTYFPDILKSLTVISSTTERSETKKTSPQIKMVQSKNDSNNPDDSDYESQQIGKEIVSQDTTGTTVPQGRKETILSQKTKKYIPEHIFSSKEIEKPSLRVSQEEYTMVSGENEEHSDWPKDPEDASQNSGKQSLDNEYTSASKEAAKPAKIYDNNESMSPESDESSLYENDDHDSKDKSILKIESYENHGFRSDETTTKTHRNQKVIIVNVKSSTKANLIYKLQK